MSDPRGPDGLGSDARALIQAARGAHEPNEISRARVSRSLELKLAAGAALAIGPTASALAGALKVTLVVASVGAVVGAGVYAVPRLTAKPVPATHRAAAAPARRIALAEPPTMPPPELAPPAPVPEAPPAVARVHHRARPVVRPAALESAAGLRAETALLASANQALGAHQIARALSLLDDYDRQASAGAVPGVLAEERTATGILALCAAGRVDAARAEARHFRARWPRSPLAARIEGSCAGRAWPVAGSTPASP